MAYTSGQPTPTYDPATDSYYQRLENENLLKESKMEYEVSANNFCDRGEAKEGKVNVGQALMGKTITFVCYLKNMEDLNVLLTTTP